MHDPASSDASRPRDATAGLRQGARIALVVAVAHAMNDTYASFLPPLLPRLMNRLDLSIALAATLAMTFSLASSVLQPLMGYAADRFGRRAFVVAGPLMSGVFISLIGLAPSFWLLMAVLTLAGLGSAAFHPPGASFAARVSEGQGSGVRLSVFSFGGSVGFAVGPLLAVALVRHRGLEGLWVAMLPILLVTPFLYRAIPPGHTERHEAHRPPSPRHVLRILAGPLGLLFGISSVGAFAQRTFLTMQPIVVAQAGGSETVGAWSLTVYLLAQSVGTLVGGTLADRVDRQRLLVGLCLLSFPAHMLAVSLTPGAPAALAFAGAAGFLGMATLPPIVVMAQEMLPRSAALGSGIVMGLAWATGSVGVLGTGVLADHIGAQGAAVASMPAILIALALALHPALGRHRRPLHAS